MFWELIATVIAGAAMAGVIMTLGLLTGGRLPRWLMPVAAGIAMIAFTIRMEYTWFERKVADFPETVVITSTNESSAFWRPWTYAAPLVDRFIAVDTAGIRTNEAVPHQRMADMLLFARWQKPQMVPMVVDCEARAAAPMLDNVTFDDSGAVENAQWAPVPEGDRTVSALCKEIQP